MNIYILDVSFAEVELLSEYKSMIWNERLAEPGDFELVMISNPENKSLLRIGTYLGTNKSPRIMKVETVEEKIDAEGERVLEISGRSLELIFTKRVARMYFTMLDQDEVWLFKDKKPAEIMREMFNKICVEGALSSSDKIPYLSTWGSADIKIYPDGDIEEPNVPITMEVGLKRLDQAFKQVTDGYPVLGYRLYRRHGMPEALYFDVYTGRDRTLNQTSNPPVIFSLPWGGLDSYTNLDTIANYYDTVYVFSKYGVVSVDKGATTGFDRNVLYLEVTGKEAENLRGNELKNYLTEKGLETLEEYRREAIFDGEIPPHSLYTYMEDYNLGDYVDLIGDGGVGARMMIIENIFVSDNEGFRSYPTFRMDEHISPDTWSGLRGGEVWSTMPGYWATFTG